MNAANRTDIIDEARFVAVTNRDSLCDGKFVYGVRSTGVYCRPSCPSRRPRRDQTEFFENPDSAEIAGYRACLRCKPTQPGPWQAKFDLAHRAIGVLSQYRNSPMELAALSRRLGASPFHVQRTFKEVLGISPREFSAALRHGTFCNAVGNAPTIAAAARTAGYRSSSRLHANTTNRLGMTPATYGRHAPGVRIRFATVPCPLGFLLVASTDKGICAVKIGDSFAPLEESLRREFSKAIIEHDSVSLTAELLALLQNLSEGTGTAHLPLDIRATAFQIRVWKALQSIRPGTTKSYSQIASSLGKPSASRAVGRACASNPAALAIPCHRAVAADGALTGYRWGTDRKRALLTQEKLAAASPGPRQKHRQPKS
ncbi:MAG: methylated-DNA--[protein]-cysteine S-methyltransferase [Candidatus Sumerlaeaceae bacterium]|nr:methylated-DNA--[protein]-cysteine S-methyltransferase [Candidatus Sumerlaeaceae bacterium]